MADIDIVAELRRLYENDPVRGNWELYGPESFGTLIFSDGSPDLHHTSSVHYATADLIVAMHEALPALLDAIDTLHWYADERNYHDPTDVPDHLYRDSGDVLLIRGGGGQRARAALAALERSGEG